MTTVTQPRYQVQFDPTQLFASHPSMATSDKLLLSVANAMNPPLPPEKCSPSGLHKMVHAQTAGAPTLTRQMVYSQHPQEAAGLANALAKQFATYLNDVYRIHSDLSLFEIPAGEARGMLEKADLSALVTSPEAKQQSTGEAITHLEGEAQPLQVELADRQQGLDQSLRDRQVA
jgi:capsular polysaccharide biosynthesis protein